MHIPTRGSMRRSAFAAFHYGAARPLWLLSGPWVICGRPKGQVDGHASQKPLKLAFRFFSSMIVGAGSRARAWYRRMRLRSTQAHSAAP